jgi:hypothetical protein
MENIVYLSKLFVDLVGLVFYTYHIEVKKNFTASAQGSGI